VFSITSDLDALTIRRDPPKGELRGTTRNSHERSGISRIRRACLHLDSLIIATAAYQPTHQAATAKRQLPVRIALLPE
jgi:hypothetical protein